VGRKISTYYAENKRGFCEVHMDFKEETPYLKFFDDNARLCYTEYATGKTLSQAEQIAEDWAMGYTAIGEIT